MIRHGKILSIDQIKAGVSTSDKNDDGVIDRAEFVQIVTKKIIFNNLLENELAWARAGCWRFSNKSFRYKK